MAWTLGTLDEIAAGQWSLVTRRQLVDVGITSHKLNSLRRMRVLRPVRRGVYAVVGSRPCWEQTLMAAVLEAGPGAVASHAAAAHLWEFVHLPADVFDVTVEGDAARRRKFGTHRTTILPAEDVTIRSDIPCTSFERTLCDCTTLLSPFQLGRVLDDGLRRGVTSLDRLKRCTGRLDSGPLGV